MRVDEIRAALENVRQVLAAGGAAAAERDLKRLVDQLAANGDRDLDQYVAEVREAISEAKAGPDAASVETAVGWLKDAGFDEAAFKAALKKIEDATAIKKDAALLIAQGYGVIRINSRSRASIIESIDKHFYWALYQRDADEMAKRATPW